MKQLNISVTRASNGYVRKEGRLTKQADRFIRMMEKEGCEVQKHKSGDMIALQKGKPMGYFFGADDTGYVFESTKDFATFLKKAEAGEFEVSTRRPSDTSGSDTPKKAAKGKKAAKDGSDLPSKRRARRKPDDSEEVTKPAPKSNRGKAPKAEAEPEIDLDEYVDEDASDVENAAEVMKLLKKELKRVKVTSENVNGLVDVVADYLKAAIKSSK